MTDTLMLSQEQDYVDLAFSAREKRREDRASGKISLKNAMIRPINAFAGESVEGLRYLGEFDDEVAFAYVEDEVVGKQYVGKYLISNDDYDVLVCSWRSNLAGKYYGANHKNPLGLTGKCLLIHESPNVLKDLELQLFKDLEQRVQNLTRENESEVSDAVLNELDRDSTGSLKEIIRTIHASQYEIISSKRSGLHVVQGAPGTGKTVVGVHRASWLLYPGNDVDLKAAKVLIVGPNVTFIKYIEKVVPGLGDNDVQHRDLGALGPKAKVTRVESSEVARIKGDIRMKRLLTQALRDRLRFPSDNFIYALPNGGKSIELSSEGLAEKLEEFRVASMSYSAARANLKIWLLNSINEILRSEYENQNFRMSRSTPFVKEADVESLTEKIWPAASPHSFLRDFYGSQTRIVAAAAELDFSVKDILLLERKPSESVANEQWSLPDIALLDYLDSQISGQTESYDFIVVDEAQDMTPMQLESIRRRSATKDILLLGDMAQGTGVWLYNSWQEIAELLGISIARFDELEFGYRVPKKIFDLASNVLTYIDASLKAPRLVRDIPEAPTINTYLSNQDLLSDLVRQLKNLDFSKGLTGLIATDELCIQISAELRKAEIEFNSLETDGIGVGLNLVPISRQKGLEFDSVFLIEPQEILDVPLVGLRQLYVAISRALRSLSIFATGELPIELLEKSMKPTFTEPEFNGRVENSRDELIANDIRGYIALKGLSMGELILLLQREMGKHL